MPPHHARLKAGNPSALSPSLSLLQAAAVLNTSEVPPVLGGCTPSRDDSSLSPHPHDPRVAPSHYEALGFEGAVKVVGLGARGISASSRLQGKSEVK
jgi:hypothetical protein